MLDYFFDDDDMCFRALVVPDKSKLHHAAFEQSHDEWYYKMYFDMLKVIFSPDASFRIYLDIEGHPRCGQGGAPPRDHLQQHVRLPS